MRVYITELSGSLSAQKKIAEVELGKVEQGCKSKVEKLEHELAELTLVSEGRVKSLTARIEELTQEHGKLSVCVCRCRPALRHLGNDQSERHVIDERPHMNGRLYII